MPLFVDITDAAQRHSAQFKHYIHLRDEVFQSYKQAVITDTTYYEGEFADDIVPDEWKKRGTKPIRPTTGYNAVENATDHILSTPDIRVSPRPTDKNKQSEQLLAESKRAFLRFFWQTVSQEQGAPLDAVKKHLVKDGKGVLKFEVDWDLVPKDQEERGALGIEDFIWKVSTLVPDMVYEDFDRPHDPRYVYEWYKITVETALATYEESDESSESNGGWRNKEPHHLVEVVEYWSKPGGNAFNSAGKEIKVSRGEHIVWVDDDVVIAAENPYNWILNPNADEGDQVTTGWVPYIIRSSGWGERKAEMDPEKYYVGLLRRDRSLLDASALHLTAASVQLMLSTFPMILAYNVPSSTDLNMGPGKIIDLPGSPDEMNMVAFSLPDVPTGVWRIIEKMEQQSDDLTKFGALGGAAVPGVDTATESDANMRNASVKLSGPLNALSAMIAEINKRAFQTVEHVVEAEVTLFGSAERGGEGASTIHPEDLGGFYRSSVQLKTSDEASLDARKVRLWTDVKSKFRGMSEQLAMEKAGIENPLATMDQAAEEEIFWSEPMQQLGQLLALLKLGTVAEPLRENFVRMLQAQNQPEGQAPPGTGDELSQEASAAQEAQAAGRQTSADRAPETVLQ